MNLQKMIAELEAERDAGRGDSGAGAAFRLRKRRGGCIASCRRLKTTCDQPGESEDAVHAIPSDGARAN